MHVTSFAVNMDFSRPEFSYLLLVIPSLFALAVTAQGFVKLAKQEHDGPVALGFGVILFVLIAASYFLFIR